jgi:hypothetical protein
MISTGRRPAELARRASYEATGVPRRLPHGWCVTCADGRVRLLGGDDLRPLATLSVFVGGGNGTWLTFELGGPLRLWRLGD